MKDEREMGNAEGQPEVSGGKAEGGQWSSLVPSHPANRDPPATVHSPLREAAVADYRALSVSAIVGLILGLLSPLAIAHPLLWSFPLAGMVISSWALWKIHRQAPVLAGRAAARWGLGLSLIFAAAGPIDRLVYQWQIEAEARQFAELWFKLLARQQPEKAFQLTMSPQLRQPLDDRLWEYYRLAPQWRLKLEQFVAPAPDGDSPRLVRTLLALGKRARVRYQGSLGYYEENPLEIVIQLYSVTFEDAGVNKTFFVIVRLGRHIQANGTANWQILGAEGGKKDEPAERGTG